MKNMNSQCTSESVMVAKKLKNAKSGAESNTKGSLQDGGTQQNMSGVRTGNDCVRGMESPHNSDTSYPPGSGGQNSENYGKVNDMSGPQMPNFNSSYMRGNFNMTDQQHGGMGNPSTGSEFPQQNSQYNHPFAQQNMRGTNFPPGSGMPRGSSAPTRPGMSANSMGMIPPNYNPNQQQRPFMSGPSIQQQGGSTPTLNQLLQNPNPTSRYQSGYGDYAMNQQKGGPENMNSQNFNTQGWNQQRPGNPYQSQMQGGGQPFRNQGPGFDGNRRHMPSGFPGQQPGGQYPNQNQFSPGSPQRYPGSQTRMAGQPYSQPPPASSSSSPATPHSPSPGQPTPDKPRDDAVTTTTAPSRHAKAASDTSDSPSLPSANNQHLQTNSSQDSTSGTGSSDDLNSDSNSTGTTSRPTPTPTPTSTPGPHSGAPLRPVPSPAGSSGSRSNTPASGTGGNSSGSPMPPRPPSNQLDGPQGRIQSPMANQQGYPGQGPSMMPPPLGPNQMMYPGANKMASNMMGPNPVGNFNSQYPHQPQGNYRGMPGMGGYGNQHSSFNGPSMPNQYNNYGSNMPGMSRSMNQYNSQYPPSSAMNSAGYNNSQFGSYGPQTTMTSSNNSSQNLQNASQQSPASSQNTPSTGSGSSASPQPARVPSPCPKGAQAAAQAAMMAAANQSVGKPPYNASSRSRSPSGSNTSQPVTPPPGQNQSTPDQQQPPPQKVQPPQQQQQHGSMQSPQGTNAGQQPSPGHHGPPSQPLHQPGLPSSGDSGPMPQSTQSGPQNQHHPTPPGGPQQQQQHPQIQPHPGMPPSQPQQQQHGMPHPSQGPHHPGMPPSGPPHMPGPGGPHHPGHPHRMYGPGHYPPQPHPGNHMNYNNMNQMNNQMPPSNNSGESNMPHYNNSVDSMGPGSGQPAYGPMAGGPSGAPPGMGPMGSRHQGPNDMTNTHGMSGGVVSVAPNMRPPNSLPPNSSMVPNSMPPNSMPVNSTNMCDMNNGIPPNAMAPSSMNMGHGAMRSSHYPPQGPDNSQPSASMHSARPGASSGGDDVSDMDCKPAISLASTIAGDSSTSVTQSINTPLTNAMETKPTMSMPGPRLMGPPPPRTTLTPSQIDSSSQDSHSSSQDSDSDKSRAKLDKIDNMSHPPTPASQVAPSPATSVHDDLENISSPSWPGTPKPDKSEKGEKSTPFNEVFNRQLEFGQEPDRRMFLERLFILMTDKACPITAMPMISKQPIDLYKLYHLVKAKGGMVDVTKNKKWRDVSGALNIGSSSSAGFTLRKNYAKYIFPLECKFDRGDVDPAPILASLETPSKSKESKKSQQAAAASQSMQDPFRGGQQGYGNFGGNMRHPQMGNADMHGPMMPPNVSMMPNNMHYEQGGMMPNSNMMPNSMMPNNNMAMGPNSMGNTGGMMPGHGGMNNANMMPNQNMPPGSGGSMGPSGMMPQTPGRTIAPGSGESISVQNPFADSPSPMTTQYQQRHGMGPNVQPYSQQQGAGGHNSPYPGYANRSGAYPPNNMSQGSYPNDSSRINSTAGNSNSSNDSFPSGGESNYVSSSSGSTPNNYQGPNNMAAQPGGSYGNQPYPNRSTGAPPSGPPPAFSQPQGPRQTPSPAPGAPTSTAQQPPQPPPAPQASPAPSTETPSETSTRSEPTHPTPPPPSMMKPTPPQLHSTDSNSSTSSQGMRPPSQPGPVPPTAQEPTPQAQPPTQMYPGPYSSTPQQAPTSQGEPFNQQASQQPPQPPQMPMMSSSGSHGNQMTQGPFSGMAQHGQGYSQSPRPYPQGPQDHSGGGYPGYHGQPGPGSGSYGLSKPGHGPQYGPQAYTPTKSYPDHRRDGYMMPPEMMSQQSQRHGSPAMGYNPNMCKRPMLPHSPMHGTHQMSPQRTDRRQYSMPSGKLQKGGPPMHRPPLEAKKEIVFPPGSVETTRAHLLKRRKLKHRDIGQTDPWRLMMALKSGQLVESTWALDTLSVLLYDDSTVAWFGLQHLPGLIEALLEHFRRCLVKIFNSDFDEMEIGAERKKELDVCRVDESLYELADEDDEMDLPQCTPQPGKDDVNDEIPELDEEEKKESSINNNKRKVWKVCTSVPDAEKLREPRNFTLKTRNGKVVKVEDGSHDEWMLKRKHWDIYDDFDSSTFDWQLGRGDATNHIITHMENKNSTDFFRKCFFKRAVSKNNEQNCGTGNIIELKEENDPVLDSSPINPEEDKFDASSPMPTLPQVGCSPKCESVKSPCSDSIDSTVKDTKTSVPKIKTEPLDNCDNESGAVIKTEPKQEDMDVDCVKQEPCELTKPKSPSSSLEEESKSTTSNPEAAVEEEDLTFISTSRQLNDLKRKWTETEEEGESYQRDDMPFMLLPEALEEVSKRCVCVSNIFRSLSFVPGNDVELSRHPGLMLVLGRLLLLHHTHPKRNPEHHKFDREVEQELGDSTEESKREWWWDTLDALRENTLVTIANISGQVNLINYPEEICLPILDGLLHWAVCPSAYAQDPMPTMSSNSVLSPQRLVLEALCKLCITDSNVDLLLATPPFSRIVQLLGSLVQMISNQGDQVMREFGIVLLSSLVQGEPSAARAVALHHPSISLLLNFIETAESQALNIANTHAHGISLLQENPEMMGTSLDMLRRTACVLRALSDVPDNRNLFQHHQHRLLQLVMSQILDHRVAAILSDVLYNCAEQS